MNPNDLTKVLDPELSSLDVAAAAPAWKPRPLHTVVVDFVAFRWDPSYQLRETRFDPDPPLQVLLVQRGKPPFEGMWALPGGFVEHGEQTGWAAIRELREETGLMLARPRALLGVYDAPGRDPRGPNIGLAYWTFLRPDVAAQQIKGQDDAAAAEWKPVAELPPLAFDHQRIISDAWARYQKDLRC